MTLEKQTVIHNFVGSFVCGALTRYPCVEENRSAAEAVQRLKAASNLVHTPIVEERVVGEHPTVRRRSSLCGHGTTQSNITVGRELFRFAGSNEGMGAATFGGVTSRQRIDLESSERIRMATRTGCCR